MIHLVTAQNASAYADQLDEMFRLRKEVFVNEKGWKLETQGDQERDEYDDDHTIYLIEFDEEGGVVAAQRLRPTDDRSMLGDHFPKAVITGIPSITGPKIWEQTRGFRVKTGRGSGRVSNRGAFPVAMIEAALAAGVERIVGFADVAMLPWFLNTGYRLQILGLPVPLDGEQNAIGYAFEVSEDALRDLRERHSYFDATELGIVPGEAAGLPPAAVASKLLAASAAR